MRALRWLAALLLVTPVVMAATQGARDENLRDQEVSEIRAAVANASHRRIITIGTVKQGCDCDENGLCTAQVAVAVQASRKASRPLTLVQIDDVWRLSRATRWQLDLEKLNAGFREQIATLPFAAQGPVRAEYYRKVDEALRERPRCHETPPLITSTPSPSPPHP